MGCCFRSIKNYVNSQGGGGAEALLVNADKGGDMGLSKIAKLYFKTEFESE